MGKKNKKGKIGRNNPCPCGSGKKYKNCCLNKFTSPIENNETFINKELLNEFQKYDRLKLLSFFSGLQLLPENHTKSIRLEYIMQIALLTREQKKEEIVPDELIAKVNKLVPSNGDIGCNEDPVENLFTQNVLFYGGNYIVYSGIYSNITQIIQNFLTTFLHKIKNIDKKGHILKTSLGILLISNEIAKRLKHTRYITSPEKEWRENIKLPSKEKISNYSDSVIFSEEDIKELFKDFNIDYNLINH